MKHILVVEEYSGYRAILGFILERAGHKVTLVQSLFQSGLTSNATRQLELDKNSEQVCGNTPLSIDAVLCSNLSFEFEPGKLITLLSERHSGIPLIVMTDSPLTQESLDVLRQTGAGVLYKPLNPCAVTGLLDRALFPNPLVPLIQSLEQPLPTGRKLEKNRSWNGSLRLPLHQEPRPSQRVIN